MRSHETPSKYEKVFRELLKEDSPSIRTDRRGGKIKVRPGYDYREGKNGKGVEIAPGSHAREDDTGQMVEVSPGSTFRQGDDGKGVAVPEDSFATTQPNGSLKVRPKPKASRRRLSQLEAIALAKNLRTGLPPAG